MEPLTEAQQQLFDWLVAYIQHYQHSPSIRQMMKAMNLKSPAPIQSRLEHLRTKGYIDWSSGRARTIRILHNPTALDSAGVAPGVPILGAIAAGGLVEPYTESVERLELGSLALDSHCFALRVIGDSMIEDFIQEGDIVILRPVTEPKRLKNGTIVAARVIGEGTTLKHFHRQAGQVTLQPGNSNYPPIQVSATQVEVQGVLVGVWRGIIGSL
jgi:repressor LexA